MTSKNSVQRKDSGISESKSGKRIGKKTKVMPTTKVQIRMTPNLKKDAEAIFDQLGVKPTDAIKMFYRQVVLKKGLPFDLVLPNEIESDQKQAFQDALQYVKDKHSDVIKALGDM